MAAISNREVPGQTHPTLHCLNKVGPGGYLSQKGIALMMVLWVLTILMVIVLSFSFAARTETHSTLIFKEGIENKFLAEAGLERGIMEIFYRRQNLNIEGSDIWAIDNRPYALQSGDGNCTVKIADEAGKVDINATSDVILKNLLMNLGVQGEKLDIIVDSIMDWKDADDLHRLHGAESDYYMSLPSPYKAKNASFDTLEELLLVKGMTPEILYGNGERKGIIDYLTVHSKMNLISVNNAPREVLTAVPGMTNEIADTIINYRQLKRITNLQEAGVPPQSMQYFSIIETNTYAIETIGYKNSQNKGYAIKAIAVVDASNKYKYLYYKSPASISR